MTARARNILIFALFFLLVVENESIFAQIIQDAINSRSNPYVHNRNKRDAEEFERQRAWEEEQRRIEGEERRMEEERLAEIRNRPSSPRRTDAGFQSPVKLNQELDALRPCASMELHGDLFTAFDGMILSATYYRGANG
jgi:hypothetical protein